MVSTESLTSNLDNPSPTLPFQQNSREVEYDSDQVWSSSLNSQSTGWCFCWWCRLQGRILVNLVISPQQILEYVVNIFYSCKSKLSMPRCNLFFPAKCHNSITLTSRDVRPLPVNNQLIQDDFCGDPLLELSVLPSSIFIHNTRSASRSNKDYGAIPILI